MLNALERFDALPPPLKGEKIDPTGSLANHWASLHKVSETCLEFISIELTGLIMEKLAAARELGSAANTEDLIVSYQLPKDLLTAELKAKTPRSDSDLEDLANLLAHKLSEAIKIKNFPCEFFQTSSNPDSAEFVILVGLREDLSLAKTKADLVSASK